MGNTDEIKSRQLAILLAANPMRDDYHTGVRTVGDVLTYAEALEFDGYEMGDDIAPDYSGEMVQEAQRSGSVAVFSSYPIKPGVFVSPSRMEAQSYAGGGKVYSKRVPLEFVAWLDSIQGQYTGDSSAA